jgi:hemerythrin superfamily protein
MADKEFTDAIALLKADHRTVEELFARFEKASGKSRKEELAREICTELKIHTMIEEEIFYAAFRGKIEDEILDEAVVEHDGAKVLINDIESGGPDEDYYDAKVKVLQEQIEHHVQEEEKPAEGMFAQCRKTEVDMVELRDRMMARKQELMAQAEAGGRPPAKPTAVEPAL